MSANTFLPDETGTKSDRRTAPKAVSVLMALVIIFVVGMVMATFVAPRLIGGSPLTISTSVMAPTLRPGDLAVVQPVHPEALALGDVVAFYTYYRYLAAQRIVDIVQGEDGSIVSLVTRVDAYYSEYSRVAADAIKGRIAYSIPMLGHVASAPIALWASVAAAVLLPAAIWHRNSFANR